MQFLKKFFHQLMKAGVTSSIDHDLERCVVLTNILSLLFSATIGFFVLVFWWMGLCAVATYCVFFSLALLPWIYCNHRGWHLIARLGLIAVSNLCGLILCLILGPRAEVHNGYICLVGVAILLFGTSSRRNIWIFIFGAGLSVSCYFFAELVPFSLIQAENIAVEQLNEIRLVLTPSYFLVVLLELYYLQQVNSQIATERNKAQEALLSSSKLAALGEMAGGMAHEINTPLGVIKARANHIKRVLEKEPINHVMISQFSDVIESTADRIAKIVQGLRDFCRDGSRDPLELADVRVIIEEAVTICADRLERSGIQLIKELPAVSIEAKCRKTELAQVLVNLLNNAHDAVYDSMQKWVNVSLQQNQEHIEIAVSDSGPGVSPELREKIFYPFFTTKDVGKGTGLGLSISAGLIEGQKGSLTLDHTAPNTRFVIRLPRVT